MINLFSVIKLPFQSKSNPICIDNWVFKLHYRATTIIFLIATILVTSREYIGDHIKCINDLHKPGFEKVIESFCFFTWTFTVERQQHDDFSLPHGISSYGVHPYGLGSQKRIRKYKYYQWVPFMLFGQAIMFYLTHLLWKKLEDNCIYKLVAGLNYSRFALLDKEVTIDDYTVPSKEEKTVCINKLKNSFVQRLSLNKSWARWFIFCEILNVLHVGFQFYITNKFLGGHFTNLGPQAYAKGVQVLDDVFPKVTKCLFYTSGPSGSLQIHDAMCIMALNIINEKIYVFLWIWFVVLFVASCLVLIWRVMSMFLYSRCMSLNQLIFAHNSRGRVYPWHIEKVVQHCDYSDWLLLKYLAKNMNGLAFKELFLNISDSDFCP